MLFSALNPYYAVCWLAAGLWILVRLAARMRQGGMERLFVFMNMTALFFGFAKTEAALYESNQKAREEAAKAAFYRQMSHKLRTPLTKISTNIQTARRRPEEAYELLARSQDEIMKMADMISDALKDGDKGAGE